jgi:hypothetical protein
MLSATGSGPLPLGRGLRVELIRLTRTSESEPQARAGTGLEARLGVGPEDLWGSESPHFTLKQLEKNKLEQQLEFTRLDCHSATSHRDGWH